MIIIKYIIVGISTRIFEKVSDENFSALLEMTLNHRFYGPEMVQNDAKGRIKEKEGRREGRTDFGLQLFVFILATIATHRSMT